MTVRHVSALGLTDSEYRVGQYGQIILWQLEGWSTVKIARQLGIARSTLYLWRDDPVFRTLEAEALRQSRDAASSDLRATVVAAVKTVRDILTNTKLDPKVSAVRLAAAKVVLENAGFIQSAGDTPLNALTEDQVDELAEKVGYRRIDAAEPDAQEAKH